MSVILKIDPSKKDIIINNNHNGITINNNNVSKRKFPAVASNYPSSRNEDWAISRLRLLNSLQTNTKIGLVSLFHPVSVPFGSLSRQNFFFGWQKQSFACNLLRSVEKETEWKFFLLSRLFCADERVFGGRFHDENKKRQQMSNFPLFWRVLCEKSSLGQLEKMLFFGQFWWWTSFGWSRFSQ